MTHENLIRQCPECGSGDVQWEDISKRPYCNECGTWGQVNYGQDQAAVEAWNKRVEIANA